MALVTCGCFRIVGVEMRKQPVYRAGMTPQERLAEIDQAIAETTKRMQFGERSTEERSIEELLKARRIIESEIAAEQGRRRALRVSIARFDDELG